MYISYNVWCSINIYYEFIRWVCSVWHIQCLCKVHTLLSKHRRDFQLGNVHFIVRAKQKLVQCTLFNWISCQSLINVKLPCNPAMRNRYSIKWQCIILQKLFLFTFYPEINAYILSNMFVHFSILAFKQCKQNKTENRN